MSALQPCLSSRPSERNASASRDPSSKQRNRSRVSRRSPGMTIFLSEAGRQNSTFFVPFCALYSQYEPKFSHFCPAARDPRGDGARAQKKGGTAGSREEGGGGKRLRESNYVAEAQSKPAPRRDGGKPQRRSPRPVHAGQARASRRDPASRSQAEPALHAGRDIAQNRSITQRAHGAAHRRRANANRLGDRVPQHRGGDR